MLSTSGHIYFGEKMNYRRKKVWLALICIGFISEAIAKEQDDSVNLGSIVVKAEVEGKEGKEGNITPTKTVMNSQSIQRFRGTGNGDVFSGIAGAQVNSVRNEAGAIDVGIRGIQGEGRVPIVIDGTIQSTHTFRGYQGESDRSYIDMDFISQVSIDRGATIGNGTTGGIGGSIQMKTLTVADVLRPEKNFGVLLKGNLYNNNKSPKIPESAVDQDHYLLKDSIKSSQFNNGAFLGAVAYQNEKLDMVAAYSHRKVGNYFAGKHGIEDYEKSVVSPGQEVVNTSYESRSGLAKVGWNITDNQRAQFNFRRHTQKAGEVMAVYWYKHLPRDPNSGTEYLWYPPEGRESMPQWSLGRSQVNTYSTDYYYQPTDNPYMNLKVSLWKTVAKIHQHNGLTIGSAGFGDQYWGSFNDERKGVSISNQSQIFNDALTFHYGAEYQTQKMTPGTTSQYDSARDGDRREKALFLNTSFKSDKFDLGFATRWHKSTTKDRRAQATRDFSGKFDFTFDVKYHLFTGLDLYSSAGSVYRSPSLFEATTSSQTFNYVAAFPLKPENKRFFELGVIGDYRNLLTNNDELRFKVNYFHNDVRNFISQALLPSINPWDYNLSFANYNRFVMRGVELGLSYKNDYLFTDLNFAQYKDPRICPHVSNQCDVVGENWGLLPTRIPPERTVTFNIGTTLDHDRAMIGARIKYHSGKDNPKGWLTGTGISGRAVEKIPATTTIDLYGHYKVNERAKMTFGVDNLTNRYAYDPGTVIAMPMPGRTIRIGFEAKF